VPVRHAARHEPVSTQGCLVDIDKDNAQNGMRKKNGDRKKQIPFWYWMMIPVILLLAQSFFLARDIGTGQLDYSDFKQLLKAGKVEDLRITDSMIIGTLKPDGLEKLLPQKKLDMLKRTNDNRRQFSTVKVEDPALVAQLENAGVSFSAQPKSDWLAGVLSWTIPILIYIWLFNSFTGGRGMARWAFDIGKSKARVYMENETGVTFKDVAGIDEAKEELMEVVEFLKKPEHYRSLGGKIPKGVLIVGAPGTGKTLLAKAVAGEAGVPFFSMSGSEFVEMFVGVGAARVRDLFAQAEQKAPCIIFIDELDAIGKARGLSVIGSDEEHGQTLNQLLVEMDGFNSSKGVIILAATNRPEVLDPALLRPGRFDRHIAIDKPDLKGRAQILAVHTRYVALASEVDLTEIAARTPGFAGADLANVVNEAALLAARRGKSQVQMSDFDDAVDRIVAGLEKKNRVMNAQEKETVAYHEAGHAVVAESRPHADRVSKISIIPRGVAALGYTQQLPTEDRYLMKKAELLDRLDVYLGGRVAEEIVFGDISTGAQNDLQLATDMARHMVTQYGMSERLGLVTFEEPRAPLLSPLAAQERKTYSERSAEAIDAEVARLLEEAHARVRDTLAARRPLLDMVARALLQKETLDRAAFDEILRRAQEGERFRQASADATA
jgi:cell division protease FtsH